MGLFDGSIGKIEFHSNDIQIKASKEFSPSKSANIKFPESGFYNKSIGTAIQFDEKGLKTVKSKTDNGMDLISYLNKENKLVKETTLDKNNSLSKYFNNEGQIALIETKSSNPQTKTSEKAYFDSLESFNNGKPIHKIKNEGLPTQVVIDYAYDKNVVKEFHKSLDKNEYFEKGFQEDNKTLKYSFYELENAKGVFNEYNAFAIDGKTPKYQLCSSKIGGKEEISEKAFQNDGKTLKFEQYTTKTEDKTVSDRKDYRNDGKTLHSETHIEAEKGKKTTDYKAYQPDGKTLEFISKTVEQNGKTTSDRKDYQSDGKTLKSETHAEIENGIKTEDTKVYQSDGKTLKSKSHAITKDGETTTTITNFAKDGKTVTSEKTTVTKKTPENAQPDSNTKPNNATNEHNKKQAIDEIMKKIEDKFKHNPDRERILSNLQTNITKLLSKVSLKEPESFITGVIRQIMTESRNTPQIISAESFEKAYASFEQKFLLAHKELLKSSEKPTQEQPNDYADSPENMNTILNIENSPKNNIEKTATEAPPVFDEEITQTIPSETKSEIKSEEKQAQTFKEKVLDKEIRKEEQDKIAKPIDKPVDKPLDNPIKPDSQPKEVEKSETPSKIKPQHDSKMQFLLNSLDTNPNIQPKTKATLLAYYTRTLLPYAEKHNIDKEILSEEFGVQLQSFMADLEGNYSEKTLNKIEQAASGRVVLNYNKRMLDKILNSEELSANDVSAVKDLTQNPNTAIAIQPVVLRNNENTYELTTSTSNRYRFDIDKIEAVAAGKIPKEQIETLIKLLALYANDTVKDRKLQEFIGATLVVNQYSSTKTNRDRDAKSSSTEYDPFSANNGI